MTSIKVYGIPNCGTCQKALKWLDSNGVNYEFINTKENPPGRETIEEWVKSPSSKTMLNTSGHSYRELGEKKLSLDGSGMDKRFCQGFHADQKTFNC